MGELIFTVMYGGSLIVMGVLVRVLLRKEMTEEVGEVREERLEPCPVRTKA